MTLKNEEEEYKLKARKFEDWRLKLKSDRQSKSENLAKKKERLKQELTKSVEKRVLEDLQLLPEKMKLSKKSAKLKELLSQQMKALANLNESEKPFLLNIEQKNKTLNELQEKLLQELKTEILTEIPNCPDDLRSYFQSGEYSSIMLKNTALTNETEKLGIALDRELIKIGITKDHFLQRMDQHSSISS